MLKSVQIHKNKIKRTGAFERSKELVYLSLTRAICNNTITMTTK